MLKSYEKKSADGAQQPIPVDGDVNRSLQNISANLEKIVAKHQAKNDEIEQKAGGADKREQKADPLDEHQLDKIADEATALVELKQSVESLQVALSRPGAINGERSADRPEQKAYNEAFEKYFRKGFEIPEDVTKAAMDKKYLSVISEPDGGFLVPAPVATRIIGRIFETSPLRGLATVETISTDSYAVLVDDDEFDANSAGEIESRSETDTARLRKGVIYAHEIYAEPKATQQLLDDAAISVESWLSAKVADRIARKENTYFISGDGVSQPRGILTYAAAADADTYQYGAIGQVASGTSATFDADDLIDLQFALKESYQASAVWLMKRGTLKHVMKLKDGEGQYLLHDTKSNNVGERFAILGNGVRLADDMPAMAANSLSVAYGDFRQAYTIVDRIGIRVLRDPYTAKPFVKFYTTKRTGGDVVNFDAYKLLKLGS